MICSVHIWCFLSFRTGNTRKSDSIYTLEPSSCFISDVISSPLKLKNMSSTTSVLNRLVT
ncbi:hypothetical protein HanRHA438_Chr15g0693601 [Helianthus annuus]|uniref:Uncharacterized protein n=1 Tax=Helianthus annuus TaxID=4232 RepID=A0A251S743_HELAN|nr:hypothetical protein HanXRQr2_Chr15g0681441 [Helianthus annuus]KAJ0450352.1 hypothetical protein HanHA300_Chr15g0555351 [Helianthus annuus]KAJ0454472.1 hypothetical protein HanIR_Chr15g0740441 [Helianthus annuus]KAJ0472180.1 hypothetical protein HanHA89_Chr15g0604131 [Helianthus annuus]KAJ0651644.1 hypothetical protein HanOQP8_Chr15g0563181 [Helianthus annuus]